MFDVDQIRCENHKCRPNVAQKRPALSETRSVDLVWATPRGGKINVLGRFLQRREHVLHLTAELSFISLRTPGAARSNADPTKLVHRSTSIFRCYWIFRPVGGGVSRSHWLYSSILRASIADVHERWREEFGQDWHDLRHIGRESDPARPLSARARPRWAWVGRSLRPLRPTWDRIRRCFRPELARHQMLVWTWRRFRPRSARIWLRFVVWESWR